MKITVKINDTVDFSLVEFSTNSFTQNPVLKIQSTDLTYIKNIFSELQKIEVYFSERLIMTTTDYDGYSSIQYLGNVYCEGEMKFVDCLQISLRKVSLVEQINRIEQKLDENIDVDSMTVDEYKEYLLKDLSTKGEQEIFEGTYVSLSDDIIESFTYNLQDQSSIKSAALLAMNVDDLTLKIMYNDHNGLCKLYTAYDILTIFLTMETFLATVKTRVNALKAYVRTLTTKEELLSIDYNTALPQEYQDHYDTIIAELFILIQAMKDKFFGETQVPSNDSDTSTTESSDVNEDSDSNV